MMLKKKAKIQSGYINRGKIEPREDGDSLLLQAKDVDADFLSYRTDALVRFMPRQSGKDSFIKPGDILFMARGARNFSILIDTLPDNVLAAACFFVVRISNSEILPEYLWWYLNQSTVEEYLKRFSGRAVHMPVVRRAVLENIDIPLPPIKIQKQVSELTMLMQREQDLIKKLTEKRKYLITGICLKSIRKSK
ncbi:MAG: restriction endonuclease subunit S [Deltaproteobacteria bacterium]|nr:restriction endonuclease subunit S [Deltaproteobacteria bacterium]